MITHQHISIMDPGTDYCQKLQKVLEFLQSSICQIHDDTLYQRLLDSLSEKMISAELAEKCGVINFLQDVKDKPEVNHDTLVFAVQLAGRLVSKITFSEAHLSIMSTLIESVLSNNLMESLSVSCAFFTTLTAVLHGPCVIDFFENLDLKGILKKSFDILRDERSIFLSRAVSDFIYSVFTSEVAKSEEARSLLKELQATIVELNNKNCQNVISPPMNCSLRVLEKVPCLFSDCFDEILDALIWLIENGNVSSVITATRCVCSLYQCQTDTEVIRLKTQVSMVMNKVDSVRCLHAAKVLFPIKIVERSDLEKVILKPLQMLDSEENPPTNFSCLSAVSLSLTVVHDCNMHNPKVCNYVSKVMRLTAGRQGEITDAGQSRNPLTGNRKIQLKCLEYLESYVCKELIPSVACTACIIASASTDHTIYRKCLDCVCTLLPEVLSSSCHSEESPVKSDLCRIRDLVQRNFCSMGWEFRDTSCEFVRDLLEKYKENDIVLNWILDSKFLVFAYQAINDGESYVRASSLLTLQTVLLSTPWLVKGLLQDMAVTMDEIITKVLDICNNDSEAFPRRRAVNLLKHCWWILCDQLEWNSLQSIIECFSKSLPLDFDWEVKLIVVNFWCMVLKMCFAADVDTRLSVSSLSLVTSPECLKFRNEDKIDQFSITTAVYVILNLFNDYDPSVGEKAYRELLWISEALEKQILEEKPPTNEKTVTFWHSCQCCRGMIEKLYEEVMEIIEPKKVGSKFSNNSDLSLLDDILSLDRDHEAEDEDNVIDCY